MGLITSANWWDILYELSTLICLIYSLKGMKSRPVRKTLVCHSSINNKSLCTNIWPSTDCHRHSLDMDNSALCTILIISFWGDLLTWFVRHLCLSITQLQQTWQHADPQNWGAGHTGRTVLVRHLLLRGAGAGGGGSWGEGEEAGLSSKSWKEFGWNSLQSD